MLVNCGKVILLLSGYSPAGVLVLAGQRISSVLGGGDGLPCRQRAERALAATARWSCRAS
jgi:hypothetical protein